MSLFKTRMVMLELLLAMLPFSVVLLQHNGIDVRVWLVLWFFVELSTATCTLVLLRWNFKQIGVVFAVQLVKLIVVLLVQYCVEEKLYFEGFLWTNTKIMLGSGLLTCLLLPRFRLINLQQHPVLPARESPLQFQLTDLFRLAALIAVLVGYVKSLEPASSEDWRGVGLHLMQIGCWFATAVSFLQQRAKWARGFVIAVAVALLFYWQMSSASFGLFFYFELYLPAHVMMTCLPLLYRCAGWRIVNYKCVEANVEGSSLELKVESPSQNCAYTT